MNHQKRLSEAEMARIICEFFAKKGYKCKQNVRLSSEERGFAREFDVVCTKKGEANYIEIKNGPFISKRIVQDLIAITQIPIFANTKFYLAVPSAAQFQIGARGLIKGSGLGLIIVRSPKHVDIIKEAFPRDKIIEDLFKESFEPFEKGQMTRSQFASSRLMLRQSFKGLLKTVTLPKPFPLRIPEELLGHIDELRNIDYKENLSSFKEQYEKARSPQDEYGIVLHALRDLWSGKYGKTQSYKSFEAFSKFEPILKQIPSYRDHLIHSFQVFLTGAIILDVFYQDFKNAYESKLKNAEKDSMELSWLLCSTFHDFCYPIQMYDQVNNSIFKEFLDLDFSPIELQIEKIMLEQNQLKYIDQMVSLYSHLTHDRGKLQWVFDSECKIDDALRSLILKELGKKNHAPLGALTLLRKIRMEKFVQQNEATYLTRRFSTDIYPAALAILLHDSELLLQMQNKISFETIPLTFLLIYCDTVQEHGRLETDADVQLKSFEFFNKTVETTLRFYDQEIYERKVSETQKVLDKINSQKLCFKLKLGFKGIEYSQNTCEQ